MTTKASTGLRNHMLTTGSLKAALDGGFLRLYSGVEPATADDAIPGGSTLLLTVFSDNVARAGADLNISSADLVAGAPQAVNYFTVALPAM